ncbi:MAG: peptidylprolyl isomerase [Chloroflexota bacterium]
MFHNRRLLIQLILFLTLGLSACASIAGTPVTPTPPEPTQTPKPPTATPPPSAATINGEYITVAEFEAELERFKAAQTELDLTFTDEDAKEMVLEDMISQVLLAQAAREAGFEITEADLKSREDALAAQAGGAEVLAKWKSDHGYDDASFRIALKRSLESAWMRDKIIAEVATTAEQVHVQQILTYNLEDAQAALAELQAGADFDELAGTYDSLTRGELGWLPRGYLLDPRADEAVFALQVGTISDIIETDIGFHIFKVIERADHPLTPDALLVLQERALTEWLAEQRAQSDIILAP